MNILGELVKDVTWFLAGMGTTLIYYRLRGYRLVAKR